jgi:hypothetical protein
MSIFGSIVSRIFRGSTLGGSGAQAQPADGGMAGAPGGATASSGQAAEPAHEARGAAPASAMPGATPSAGASSAASPVDVEAVLAGMEAQAGQKLNWRSSIVDLMKLLDIDSSLGARKELAQELGYGGALDGSAEMNMWLHRAVMQKLAENGGRVPDSLRD